MDWTSLGAAAIGAGIGLSGDLVGRLGARRQARDARRIALEDATMAHTQAQEDERQREIRSRARMSAEKILEAFRINYIDLGGPVTNEVHERVRDIASVLYAEYLYLPHLELRRRILEIEHWLDGAQNAENFGPLTLREVAFAAKNEANRILGMWLRGEEVDYNPSTLWASVQKEAPEFMRQLEKALLASGIQTKIPIRPEYY